MPMHSKIVVHPSRCIQISTTGTISNDDARRIRTPRVALRGVGIWIHTHVHMLANNRKVSAHNVGAEDEVSSFALHDTILHSSSIRLSHEVSAERQGDLSHMPGRRAPSIAMRSCQESTPYCFLISTVRTETNKGLGRSVRSLVRSILCSLSPKGKKTPWVPRAVEEAFQDLMYSGHVAASADLLPGRNAHRRKSGSDPLGSQETAIYSWGPHHQSRGSRDRPRVRDALPRKKPEPIPRFSWYGTRPEISRREK